MCVGASLLRSADFVNGQAARAVIGRYGFDRGDTGVNVQLDGGVSGLAYANGMLFVADSNLVAAITNNPASGASQQDNRVLMYYTSQIPGPNTDVSTLPILDTVCPLCGFAAQNVLGQTDYVSTNPGLSQTQLSTPTAVATDGTVLAVADTGNNRVLIWTSIPTTPGAPASFVLGQSNFTSRAVGSAVTAQTMRGPQGVWIQNGKLFVADTQNSRILIWNSIPNSNNQPADLVLGQPNLTSANQPPAGTLNPTAAANQLASPVSVTSDGTRLYVADLAFNRVLIWNSIPTAMDQAADVVVGQPNMTSAVANNSSALCASNGTDSNGNATYPAECEKTLNFPRYAISDGTKLYIADGGNDRVLIYNTIPQSNGVPADRVLGQPDFLSDVVTNQSNAIITTVVDNTASVNTIPTPLSLALDGTNLYVSDPYNRRVLVFTPTNTVLASNSVLNWASEIIRQEGSVTILVSSIVANDTVTVTIAGTNYVYTVKSADTPDKIAQGLVSLINASDPNATAVLGPAGSGTVELSSKGVDLNADTISLSATTSNTTDLTAGVSGAYLAAGTAATVAPGTLVEINGSNLSDQTIPVFAPTNGQQLSITLGGAQVYMDGFSAPLLRVSSTQIIAQVPYEFGDRNSTSVYVRTQHNDGSVTATNATAVSITQANPGLFNSPSYVNQPRPWPAVNALHQNSNPEAILAVGGTVKASDVATISINGTAYNYTVQSSDTLATIVSGLVSAINGANSGSGDPNVIAAAGPSTTVIVTARKSGAAGANIPVSGTASSGASVSITAYSGGTCCVVAVPGSLITPQNPALAGELITLMGDGLGPVQDVSGNAISQVDGQPYSGPQPNSTVNSAFATVNGTTAQVVSAGLPAGSYGIFQVQVLLPSTLTPNPNTQINISQNAFISNTVTIAVGNGPEYLPGGYVPLTGPPQAYPSPAIVSFGNIPNFSTPTRVITVTNPGGNPLAFFSIALSGTNAGDFSVSPAAVNPCSTSTPLAAGATCTILVTFNRTASGTRTASLIFTDDAYPTQTQSVSLQGFDISEFEIINKLSGKALDVMNASTQNGGLLQQYDFLNGLNQKWTVVPVDTQYYEIVSVATGKVLDDTGYSTVDGTLIQQWDYTGGDNQKWQLVPVDGGYYAIQNKLSGKVLDVTDLSLQDGALIQQWDYVGGDNQKWQISPITYTQIINKLSGKVLDDTNFSTANGTPIQQWDPTGGDNQLWTFEATGGGYQAIRNKLSGKVLDNTTSTSDGTPIQQFDYSGGDQQQWLLVPTSNGYYAIYNKLSGKALDDTNFSTANGTVMQQWDYVGGDNQQWQIVVVPPSFP